MLSRLLKHRLGYTYKKPLIATERGRARVRWMRHIWFHNRQPRMRLEPHRLVFIDETSLTTKMTRLRGRSPRGDRLEADAPFGHWHTQTFIAELRFGEHKAPWVHDGPMNRAAFDIYIESQLALTLQPGDVVIADNLSSHKSAKAQKILKAQGNWLLFLPPYSPDLNPIEMAFAKLKTHLRHLQARTFNTLLSSVGQTCHLFEETEGPNYFKAAGYRAD